MVMVEVEPAISFNSSIVAILLELIRLRMDSSRSLVSLMWYNFPYFVIDRGNYITSGELKKGYNILVLCKLAKWLRGPDCFNLVYFSTKM